MTPPLYEKKDAEALSRTPAELHDRGEARGGDGKRRRVGLGVLLIPIGLFGAIVGGWFVLVGFRNLPSGGEDGGSLLFGGGLALLGLLMGLFWLVLCVLGVRSVMR